MHNVTHPKFLNLANLIFNQSTLKFWISQILDPRQKYIDQLCILLCRNIPLLWNSVWIFFVSSDQPGIF